MATEHYTLCIPRVLRDISTKDLRTYLEKAKIGKILILTEYNANDPLYKKIVFRVKMEKSLENYELVDKCSRSKDNNYFKLVYEFPWYWRIYVNQQIKPNKTTNESVESVESVESLESLESVESVESVSETTESVMGDIITQIEEAHQSPKQPQKSRPPKQPPKQPQKSRPPGLELIHSPFVSLIPLTQNHCQYMMLDKLYPYTQTPYVNPNYQIQMQSIGLLLGGGLHRMVA